MPRTEMKVSNDANIKPPCYIIAEAGLNHNGSMELAKKLIDAAAIAQVDAVKFQKRDVASLATKAVLDGEDNRFPMLGKTYRQIRESLEFSKEEYQELKSYTENKGLDFICTAFDIQSVDFLEEIGLQYYKIASHSITNLPLLEYISSLNKKVILSTGMCDMDEITQSVDILSKGCKELILLHCVSSYPQSFEETNLCLINVLKKRFELPVGYSGHEIGYLPTLAAVSMGVIMVERHFTLDKNMEGFDHKLSLEPQELTSMVREIRTIEKCFGSGTKEILKTEQITRDKYHVSMVSIRDIKKGEVITSDMITYKNPGTGLKPKDAPKILGKKALEDIPCDNLIDLSKVVISVFSESEPIVTDQPASSKSENISIAAICPVLRKFDSEKMDILLDDFRGTSSIDSIYIVSELEQVAGYCQERGCGFIKRPNAIMPDNSTIEDMLKYAIEEVEKCNFFPDYIFYSNYAFSKRPKNLFLTLINEILNKHLDTVFLATEIFSNIWKKNSNGEYIMMGDWLSHEKRDPMYMAINGLGTITRSCFVKQGKLIGKKVGLIATNNYFTKD